PTTPPSPEEQGMEMWHATHPTTPAPPTYPPDCLGCGTRYIDHGEPGLACPLFEGGFSSEHHYRNTPTTPAPRCECGITQYLVNAATGICVRCDRPREGFGPTAKRAGEPIIQSMLCGGGNVARFTRPARPTYHCGDPVCVCMVARPAAPHGGEPAEATRLLERFDEVLAYIAPRISAGDVINLAQWFNLALALASPPAGPTPEQINALIAAGRDEPGYIQTFTTASGGAPETAPLTDAEAMLRKHMGMYDWTKAEARAINDFILTVRFGMQE